MLTPKPKPGRTIDLCKNSKALLLSINFTSQVKQARNQSQNFNRKSISRNATHHHSLDLQAMLTGETLKDKNKVRESKQPQDCSET